MSILCSTVAPRRFARPTATSNAHAQRSDTGVVPPEYFGIHVHRLLPRAGEFASPWPDIGAGSIRLWDAYVSWADLEPAPGVWRFERLDSLVALAAAHRVTVYLTLGRTPRWASSRADEHSAYGLGEQAMPRDLSAWRNYARTVARRYRGRIAGYEIWNEPNQPGMFSGSVSDMATLASAAYQAVKQSDPDAIVISPSPTRGADGIEWLVRFERAGGLRSADVVAFHPYVTDGTPEAIVPLVTALADRLADSSRHSLPIWITELGWFIQDSDGSVMRAPTPDAFDHTVLSDSLASAYVARSLVLGWCSGAKRLMWYAWDNRRMGLLGHDGREKLSAIAYRTISGWMAGATVSNCSRSLGGVWRVSLVRPDRPPAQIIWNERPQPPAWSSGLTVDGTALSPTNASRVDVDAAAHWGIPMLVAAPARY